MKLWRPGSTCAILLALAAVGVAPTRPAAACAMHTFHLAVDTNAIPQLYRLPATPCVGGMAGIYPCNNVDLMAFLPIGAIGGSGTIRVSSLWGWTDPDTQREYAIVGRTNGTAFVDITDAANSVYLGNLPTHTGISSWREMKTYGYYAYIVSDNNGNHGIQIFDLRRLRNVPSPPQQFTEDGWYGETPQNPERVRNVHNIIINTDTGFAYAVGSDKCGSGLHMVDLSDPVNPTFAGCFSADGYTHDGQCVTYHGPDAAYTGHEICFNSNTDTLTIVDVTNHAAPVMLSRTPYAGSGYTHQGWLTDDHGRMLIDDELDEQNFGHPTWTYIWNLSDLDAPFLVGHFTGTTNAIDHNQFIHNGYSYQANYQAGLRIIDIAGINTGNLSEVAYFDIYPSSNNPSFNGAWNNYPFFASGNVIVSGIEQGLFVVHPNLVPNLSVSDVSVSETAGTATFTVTLSSPPAQAVTATFQTIDGTAVGGVDYVPASGVLTIPAGSVTGTVDVTILDDLLDENDETFSLKLSNVAGAHVVVGFAEGTILDDDPLPTLSIGDVSKIEGNSGTAPFALTISLTPVSGRDVRVDWADAAGTATPGVDYLTCSGTVVLPAGVTQASVSCAVIGDLAWEPDETFFVNLVNPVFAVLGDPQGTAVILNDDPTVTFQAGRELNHGFEAVYDLAALPGPLSHQDWFRLGQEARASYEIAVDAAGGDTRPLQLQRMGPDGVTVLQSAPDVGPGESRSLRFENATPAAVTEERVRVASGGCGVDCGSEDTYRLRAWETTASIPRFNNAGSQLTVLVLQNTTSAPVVGNAWMWGLNGALVATLPIALAPHGQMVVDTSSLAPGQGGSITVSNDAPYGSLAGKAVALELLTGFSFDTPLVYRPR